MSSSQYDVVGLGNAIVDVIARTEENFLLLEGLNKGSMSLINEDQSKRLLEAMGPRTVISGGSAANTIVGVGSFGGKAAFIGKVRSDASGNAFSHDIRAMGVNFSTAPSNDGPATATCLVLVTPDGERTMSTYLGAAQNLTVNDVDQNIIEASKITYLEGYLWDPPQAKEAFTKAAAIAHGAKRQVALTLSDAFCVDRYRDEFIHLIRSRTVDIVFANQHELKSLYQTADFDAAVSALRAENIIGVVTKSSEGSLVVTREGTHAVPAYPIEKLVDTTGAGDLYAAGFLFGMTQSRDYTDCARLGALAASEIIQHFGARPELSLRQLATDSGLA
jgi:sugar/nucleoside kinase (ribokinase family)